MNSLNKLFSNLLLLLLSSAILYLGYISASTLSGDNANYYNGWKALNGNTFIEAFKLHAIEISSVEPIYFFFAYLSNNFLNYASYILLLNVVFLVSIYLFFRKYFRNYKIIYTYMLFTNIYIYVNILETHRLKLAITFFLLSIVFLNKKKYFILLSILSHLQIIIVYISIELNKFLVRLLKFKLNYKLLLFFIVVILIAYIFNSHIIDKLVYYNQIERFPLNTLILIFGYIFYLFIFKVKQDSYFWTLGILVLFLSFFISSDRLNLFLVTYILTVEINQLLHNKKRALIILFPFTIYHLLKVFLWVQQLLNSFNN